MCAPREIQHAQSLTDVPIENFNHYLHLGKLGGSSAGNFGHTELRQFIFQVVQLLKQLLFLLTPEVPCLDLGLNQTRFERNWI